MSDQKKESKKTTVPGILILGWDHTVIDGYLDELIMSLIAFNQIHASKDTLEDGVIDDFVRQMYREKHLPKGALNNLKVWIKEHFKDFKVEIGDTINVSIDTATINQIAALIPPIGDAEPWKKIISGWIDAGGIVSINTFSLFKEHLKNYFKQVIGLEDHYVEKILIEGDCESHHQNKNTSILAVLEKHVSKFMVFVDTDSVPKLRIIDAAEVMAEELTNPFCDGIVERADSKGSHLDKLEKHLKTLQNLTLKKPQTNFFHGRVNVNTNGSLVSTDSAAPNSSPKSPSEIFPQPAVQEQPGQPPAIHNNTGAVTPTS